MITEIRIQNFKSIRDLKLKLGRVTVLIGENGSGKSNILEGIAFAGAAAANKLDGEFLANRGIRVPEDTWTRSAFPEEETDDGADKGEILLSVKGGDGEPVFDCSVSSSVREEDKSFAGWFVNVRVDKTELDQALQDEEFSKAVTKELGEFFQSNHGKKLRKKDDLQEGLIESLLKDIIARRRLRLKKQKQLGESASTLGLTDFIIYAPENTVLRTPPAEGAILPLGSKGEGLIRLLQSFTDLQITDPKLAGRFEDLTKRLHLFGWFDNLLPPDDSATLQARLQIRDRWLAQDRAIFDQRSANEGFLYVLFYFTLLMSWRTPKFFAIDNIDSALNPKLCSALVRQIVELARKYGKQVILTTHNPAVLDGLDLHNDDERLFTVGRDSEGRTKVRRVRAPEPQPGEIPVRLSEAFVRGLIGGLPDNF